MLVNIGHGPIEMALAMIAGTRQQVKVTQSRDELLLKSAESSVYY